MDRGSPEFPRPAGSWWFGCDKDAPLNDDNGGGGFSIDTDDGTISFFLKSLNKEDAAISLSFDSVGDEFLDVIAPDE